jgi:hypothetical protein
MARVRRLAITAAVTVGAAGLAACTSSSPAAPAGQPVHSTPGSTAAGTVVAHHKPINPLTGRAPSKNPVVAVRIDDTSAGRPQLGVNKADIVYIGQVEGGLTRLLAIFNSTLPTVEPVRSTRADNPQLALEYGHIDYVTSGGDAPELAPLDHSPLRSDINDRGGPGFVRDPHRISPENLKANLAVIAKKMKGPKAKSIGLTWSSHFAAKGSKPGRAVHTEVGATPVSFVWRPSLHRYVRVIDGAVQKTATGAVVSTPNVIVQWCRVTTYWRDKDVDHNPAAWTHTLGSGKIVVFRNGRQIAGTWHRHKLASGTVLRDTKGHSIPLAPGGAWFVLVNKGTPLH